MSNPFFKAILIFMKKSIFLLIIILFTYLIIEGICAISLTILENKKKLTFKRIRPVYSSKVSNKHKNIIKKTIENKKNYTVFDPRLGWSINPSTANELFRSNADGIRADKEYTKIPEIGKLRISAFGDSFTHGDEVHNNETWEAYLNQINSNLEVINFGVGGYGLDQAYLRYQHLGKDYNSHIVLIGILTENIRRHMNNFRPFLKPNTGIPFSKPRFKLTDGKLDLVENPLNSINDYQRLLNKPRIVLNELGQQDYYFQTRQHRSIFDVLPSVRLIKIVLDQHRKKFSKNNIFVNGNYNPDSEAFTLTIKIIEEFYNMVENDGAKPVILVIPRKSDIRTYRKTNKKPYQILIDYLEKKQLAYIEIIELFNINEIAKESQRKDLFVRAHYSPLMNQFVAQYIYHNLKNKGWLGKFLLEFNSFFYKH